MLDLKIYTVGISGSGEGKIIYLLPSPPKLYYCITTNLFYKSIFFAFDDENIIIIDHDKTNILTFKKQFDFMLRNIHSKF